MIKTFFCFFSVFLFLNLAKPVEAIVDPLLTSNNKFGIHIISPDKNEASQAGELVNSSGGDWGYITLVVNSNNRDQNTWQTFFDFLREKHLIPILRLATKAEGSFWKVPLDGDEIAWADFLDNLVWPTKNRYITIYNEPNQGQEWGGKVDPVSYARVLNKTIDALKQKNSDFFVLNAGFDASSPNKPPLYMDESTYLEIMEKTVPGIFEKLDGWVSHSYPNPGFVGSPNGYGKGSVRTWEWELQQLKSLGLNKNLPVFITETGWKHAEGIFLDKSLPSAEIVGKYFKTSFASAWSDPRIIAVTPFLLNYQEEPFDHFSFKKISSKSQDLKILGVSFPEYYPHYQILLEIPKTSGKPKQELKVSLSNGVIFDTLVSEESYIFPLTFKNTGQSIWNDGGQIELRSISSSQTLEIPSVKLPIDKKVKPGEEATFSVMLKAPDSGVFNIDLQLFQDQQPFDSKPFTFSTKVKPPVIMEIFSKLKYKKDYSGEYTLIIETDSQKTIKAISLDTLGKSIDLEARYLLPEHNFKFTLEKDFYKPKTISVTLQSGINRLNFGELQPNFFKALLNPTELWKLLPFPY